MPIYGSNGNIIKEPKECKYCGKVFDYSIRYSDVEDGSCFGCWFWKDHLKLDMSIHKECFAIIDGHHYLIGDEPTPNERGRVMLGFGGSKFTIKFFDGRTVVTHNLCHQGEIPQYWRNRLPDNAKFVKEVNNVHSSQLQDQEGSKGSCG